MVEENEKLREAVGVLRAAMKQLSGAKAVNSRQVWKFAREIKKKYESKVRVNDLGENLRRVYDAMANARTDAEGKRAMEAMAAIARNMLENSEHINRGHVRQICGHARLPAQGTVSTDGSAMG